MNLKIELSPVACLTGARTLSPLRLEKTADGIVVNDETFDLSVIPDGATLPDAAKATGCKYFTGAIEHMDGELHLTLLLPHSDRPTQAQAFPEPLTVTQDGPIPLPTDEPDLDGKTAQEVYDAHH